MASLATVDRLRAAARLLRDGATVAKRAGLLGLPPRVALEFARANGGQRLGPPQLLRLHALADPRRPAVVTSERRLSYGELDARVNRLAGGLAERGVGAGDRVALLLRNGHEHIEAAAALGHRGAFAVQIGYRSKPKEIAYILDHAEPKALLFHADYGDAVTAALAESRRLTADDCFAAATRDAPAGAPRFPGYDELFTGDPSAPPRPTGGGFGGVMVYTSGTTGQAKGASRDFSKTGLATVLHFIAQLPLEHDERHLAVCPFYHSAAPAFIAFTMIVGGCVVVVDHFAAEAVLDTMARERITSSLMVPTMLRRLVELGAPAIRRRDLGPLRWLMSAAAPLPTALAREVEESFGPLLYNFYGATETGLVTLARPGEHTARPGTIGRLLPGNEARLLDDAGREVAAGAVGELYVRNAMLVAGYHRNEAASRAASRDGFFSVGDLARRDEDGFLYLADRKHDMVISGGVNIYPFEIEQRLHQHPAVSEAAVIGVPDPEWGERLVAFIVLRPGAAATAEELQRFVAVELADFKRPRQVEFIDALPRNPTGKVLKRELKARLAQAG